MYLYFDRAGVLKEIINNQPARSTASNVNKLYVYIEGMENDGADNLWVRYQYNTDQVTAETEVTDRLTGNSKIEIPFNKERDLKYFKYFTKYEFFVATVPDAVLQVNGNVLATFRAVLNGTAINPLGLVTFNVEYTVGQLVGTIEYDGYVSISQFNYLIEQMSNVENGLTFVIDLGEVSIPTTVDSYVDIPISNETYLKISEPKSIIKVSDSQDIYYFSKQSKLSGQTWVCINGSDLYVLLEFGEYNNYYLRLYYRGFIAKKNYVDSNFVNLTGNQTIAGQKTFSGKAIFNDANLYNGYITTNSKNYFAKVGVTTGQYVTYKLPYNYSDIGAVSLTLATENYVDDQIDAAIASLGDVFNYRGSFSVSYINTNLTSDVLVKGDVVNVTDSGTLTLGNVQVVAGDNVVWNGTTWDRLAGDYVTVSGTQTITGTKTFQGELKFQGSGTSTVGQITTTNYSVKIGYDNTNIIAIDGNCMYTLGADYDLGSNSKKWRDVYLSRNLSDGTNSISVANIVNTNNLLASDQDIEDIMEA